MRNVIQLAFQMLIISTADGRPNLDLGTAGRVDLAIPKDGDKSSQSMHITPGICVEGCEIKRSSFCLPFARGASSSYICVATVVIRYAETEKPTSYA